MISPTTLWSPRYDEYAGTPKQKWANDHAANQMRCRPRLNFVFQVLILALLVSYKSYATLCSNS